MVNYYDEHIVFTDPVFGELRGENAKNMWRMLVDESKGNLKITFDNVHADDNRGTANWAAAYVFGKTGRKVINKISARFEFRNGKVMRHTDHFDLWRWSRQALGYKGYLFGWTPFMKIQIQKQTINLLKTYCKNRLSCLQIIVANSPL